LATHEIFMPALSSTMTEGKIVEWLKQPGDRVERGESVLVVESDKADMDVESFNEGFLAAVLMPAGGTAPVGETIGLIVESEAEIAAVQASASTAAAAAPAR
jgi:pyruvate dehydrogenase E2 component (dihydrolipoamide acetyltransferase)